MYKRILSVALAGLLVNLVCYTSVAADPQVKENESAAGFKATVAKLAADPGARVEAKLRDKTKLKGYVAEVDGEGFTVVNEKTGAATRVTYQQVQQIKRRNRLTGHQVGSIAGYVAVFALIVVTAIGYARK